jgi:hypothetical protein
MSETGRRVVFGLAIGLVVLTGCDGGGSAPSPTNANSTTGLSGAPTTATSRPGGAEAPTSAAQDKCRIVSATALKAAVGGKMVAETSGLSGVGNAVCTFEFSKSTHQTTRISLSANQSGSKGTFRKTTARTTGAQTVPGLGDGAFFVKATSTLQLLTGAKVVIIQATARAAGAVGAVPAISRAVLVKVAKAVLAQ